MLPLVLDFANCNQSLRCKSYIWWSIKCLVRPEISELLADFKLSKPLSSIPSPNVGTAHTNISCSFFFFFKYYHNLCGWRDCSNTECVYLYMQIEVLRYCRSSNHNLDIDLVWETYVRALRFQVRLKAFGEMRIIALIPLKLTAKIHVWSVNLGVMFSRLCIHC